ncbi:hypothetical protein E8E13_000013 [Curvularia kusanoi]|uniref:Peptidase M12A domain-containing protein n=1 Tax=Curvularia kusanoi TaxID=90978 RepID=A0A9P4T607_CURKU|nr:hypothetical protein E8E13_000013 [Curvularia kusanoi]
MVPDISAALGKRAASELVTYMKEPWPVSTRNGRQLRVITYCYDDQATRMRLDCHIVREAIFRWEQKLYPRGYNPTTNVRFEEAHDGHPNPGQRQPYFCLVPTTDGSRSWNLLVPADTLRITMNERPPSIAGGGAISTTGYTPGPLDEVFGRHFISVVPYGILADDVYNVAHEIGHVLGMLHEFTRSDRDDYVNYDCRVVAGFQRAVTDARQANPQLSLDEVQLRLCEDEDFAREFDFDGSQFVRRLHNDEDHFDIDSIMMYGSSAFGYATCANDDSQCPLLKYGEDNGVIDKNLPKVKFLGRRWPSDGDKRWVEKWYPA